VLNDSKASHFPRRQSKPSQASTDYMSSKLPTEPTQAAARRDSKQSPAGILLPVSTPTRKFSTQDPC
jgi:hypothetical protein